MSLGGTQPDTNAHPPRAATTRSLRHAEATVTLETVMVTLWLSAFAAGNLLYRSKRTIGGARHRARNA